MTSRQRTFCFKDPCPGRVGERAEFFYYHPICKRLIDEERAESRNRGIRFVPVGHPINYEYSQDVVGWGTEYGAVSGDDFVPEVAVGLRKIPAQKIVQHAVCR